MPNFDGAQLAQAMRIAETIAPEQRGRFLNDLSTALAVTSTSDVIGMAVRSQRAFAARAQLSECCGGDCSERHQGVPV